MFNRSKFALWVENYLFYPSFAQRLLSYILLPFSAIYCLVVWKKRRDGKAKKMRFNVPIISIGNLTVGGNGKTPFCIALADGLKDSAIILRGYGRKSRGLIVISEQGQILCDVMASGDEAMLYAKALPQATVIVSENRVDAILLAQQKGAKILFLDDGFSKSYIEKIDILIKPNPQPKNHFCLPSGPYRESPNCYKEADLVVEEGSDFTRQVHIQNPTQRMLLITAIAKPSRLDPFLPNDLVGKVIFPDHYMYSEKELEVLVSLHNATSILTTQKDAVKMALCGIPLSILKLDIEISPTTKEKINTLLSSYKLK